MIMELQVGKRARILDGTQALQPTQFGGCTGVIFEVDGEKIGINLDEPRGGYSRCWMRACLVEVVPPTLQEFLANNPRRWYHKLFWGWVWYQKNIDALSVRWWRDCSPLHRRVNSCLEIVLNLHTDRPVGFDIYGLGALWKKIWK